jgi:uncharacterized phage protein (TIGR02218 family)
MGYADRETSRYGGQPVEGYRFVSGDTVWLFTSADREITLPIGRFAPDPLIRNELTQTKEDASERITVTVPRTSPIAALFVGEVPSSPVWFTLYRAHRGDEVDTLTAFKGKITSALFEGSEVKLAATSISTALLRTVPVVQMQSPCNLVLYSAECGANPTSCRDAVTITTVNGRVVTSNDFALRADGWFNGGRLQDASGEMRFIGDHVGNTVKLLSPFPGLESLAECYAYWGCSHLAGTCASKFNRLASFLGWSYIPIKNPFTSRMDTPAEVYDSWE